MAKKPVTSTFWPEFFGFLRSRNGLFLGLLVITLVAIRLAVVNLEEIKELAAYLKGLIE